MKKILFRKLLSDCLVFFFLSLISISAIIWVFQAVNFLDIIIEDGRNYFVYINYSLLNFPKIISKVLPFVLFFSFIFVITKYEMNNELIIFWNFGVSKIELVNFFFKISLLIMVFQIILTSVIVPRSQDLARSFLRTSTMDFFEAFIKPRKFNDSVKGLTIFIDSKNKDGELKEIYLKKGDSTENFQITFAKKGKFKKVKGIQILELYSGETISIINDKITNFKFSKSDFNLNNLEPNTTTYKKTQEVTTFNLVRCYGKLNNFNLLNSNQNFSVENCRDENLDNILKELYKRIIIPIYIPVLILISFLLIIRSKENVNYLRYRIFIFFLGIFAIIISEMTLRFIDREFLENIKIIIIPLILISFLYMVFLSKLNFKESKL